MAKEERRNSMYIFESNGPVQTIEKDIPDDTTVIGFNTQLIIKGGIRIGDRVIIRSCGKPTIDKTAIIGKDVICFEYEEGQKRTAHKWLIKPNHKFEHALGPTDKFQLSQRAKEKDENKEANEATNCCKPCVLM